MSKTTISSFHCAVAAAVDLDRKPNIVEYDLADWSRRCKYHDGDGLTFCPNMRGVLRLLGVLDDQCDDEPPRP